MNCEKLHEKTAYFPVVMQYLVTQFLLVYEYLWKDLPVSIKVTCTLSRCRSFIMCIIIHQTRYEKSDWSMAFNQFTIACSIHNSLWTWHDKCNICCRYCIYHVKFKVCLVTKPLGVFSSETKWLNASLLFLRMNYVKMYNKTIIEFGFHMISWIIKTSCLCYLPKPR